MNLVLQQGVNSIKEADDGKHNSVIVGILKRDLITVVEAIVLPGFGGDADQRVH